MSFINSARNIFFQKFSFRFSRGSTKGDDVWTDRPCWFHVILNIERIFDEISFFSFFHFFHFSLPNIRSLTLPRYMGFLINRYSSEKTCNYEDIIINEILFFYLRKSLLESPFLLEKV